MRHWSLSDLALNRPVTIGMVLVAVFLLGVIATFKLPLAFLPTADITRARVRVDVDRTSPEVLEREVIRPLEEHVAGIRDTKRIRVSSGSWGVRLDLEFETGTDIAARKLELRERVDRLRGKLPDLVQRVEVSSSRGDADSPILRIRIAGKQNLENRYYLIERRIVRQLERIKGVARVELSGVEPHELEVAVDVEAVSRNGIVAEDITRVVRSAHQARGMGILRDAVTQAGVRTRASAADPRAIAHLPIPRRLASKSGGAAAVPTVGVSLAEEEPPGRQRFAQLGEVARVDLHPKEKRRGSRLNGRPAIDLDVFGDAGASVVDVSRAVRSAVERMRADAALGGIEVSVFRDQGEVIVETLGDLRDTGIYGGLIGIVVLFVFLHRLRTTLAAALCIPLSVLTACGVLFVRGEELNCIVLLGLVLCVGMLIDNAVVIVESIQLHLSRGEAPLVAAREGAREVGLATVASTLSSVIVFLPLVLGSDANPMTRFLRPLGGTFVIGLLASLFVSQSIVPLMMGRLAATSLRPTRHRVLSRLSWAYGWLIERTLRFPRLTVIAGACVTASAFVPVDQLGYELGDIESRPQGLPVRLEMIGSGDYRRVIGHLEVMEQALLPRRDELGIDKLACRYRDWGGDCDVYPQHATETEAEMSNFEARITGALPQQAGIKYHVGPGARGWHGRSRDPRVVNFVVRGEDMGVLNELADQIAAYLKTRLPAGDPNEPDGGGLDEITGPSNEGGHEYVISLDTERIHRLGLDADQIASKVSRAFQGLGLGQVQGPQGEVTLRLSSRAAGAVGGVGAIAAGAGKEPDLADVRDLRIDLPGGSELPLAALATFRVERSPYWVQRVDRQTEIRMKVRFYSAGHANRETIYRLLAQFRLPQGYSAGEGTRWWRRDQDANEMLIDLALCLLLVYAVMASLFESYLQPLAILVTCLLGCFGAPWAMWATGTTVDTVALIGLFILIGIVVNNGIMLIDRVTRLRAQGISRHDALRRAGEERLRPILMTAGTTILCLVPMLIHHPTLAGVYYHSIAIIIAGGLLTSTVTSLVVLPAAYTWIEELSLDAGFRWRRVARSRAGSRGRSGAGRLERERSDDEASDGPLG
ncbi:MAG: efflux RND transporter permease subunit [Nannocystaceae bacterium]